MSTDLLEGLAIGDRYRLTTRVGSGGMATVYRGEHVALQKAVAIKVLSAELASDPDMAKRFEREAALAARLDHPHCVAVTDFGRLPTTGQPYLVMDLVDGEPLDVVLRRGRLEHRRAVELMRQILRGLARAHDLGVVHRDLKPSNILVAHLAERDHARLIDFGIAKTWDGSKAGPRVETQAGMVFGTPDFIAPERLAGKSDTDPRSDLYAATVVFYEMLTNRRPFEDPDPVATARKALTQQALPPSVILKEREPDATLPEAIDALVMRGLNKDPDQRFASARAYLSELDTLGPRPTGAYAALTPATRAVGGAVPPPGAAASGMIESSAPVRGAPETSLTSLAARSVAGAGPGEAPRGVLTEAMAGMGAPAAAGAHAAPAPDDLDLPPRQKPPVWVWVGGVVLLVILIGVVISSVSKKDGKGGPADTPLAGGGVTQPLQGDVAAAKSGNGEIADLIAAAGSGKSVGERAKAADRLVVLGYNDKVPWRQKLELDLVQTGTCEGRRDVVRELARRKDKKSIPALEAARARAANGCLRTDAAQAIVELGGTVEDDAAASTRPGEGEPPPRRRRTTDEPSGGGHF